MPNPFRPETSALVLIDHQVGTMQLIKTLNVKVVKRNTLELAGVAFTATNTIIAELTQDWSTPPGGELIRLLFADVRPEVKPVADGSAAAA